MIIKKSQITRLPVEKRFILPIIAFTTVAYIIIFATANNIDLKYLSSNSIAYAQINSKTGISTTLIGDTSIPYSTSNDTKTTVVDNATTSNISTSIDRSAIALNSTAANIFAKESPTFPISPTGISTEGLQQPPEHRILNNTVIPSGK